MSNNFFNFDSSYQYEPIIKQIDEKLVTKDVHQVRLKILEYINQVVRQQELSRAELATSARIASQVAGKLLRNDMEKISTDRLLKVARRLGLKPKIKFEIEK